MSQSIVGLERLEERLLLDGGGGLLPLLSIDDVSVVEGTAVDGWPYLRPDGSWVPSAPHLAEFTVTLSEPSADTVTVSYTTEPETAIEGLLVQWSSDLLLPGCTVVSPPPNCPDYVHEEGTLTFAPGETTKTIDVTIVPDGRDEYDETFRVEISAYAGLGDGGPESGPEFLGSSSVTATIVNDDCDDVPQAEDDSYTIDEDTVLSD